MRAKTLKTMTLRSLGLLASLSLLSACPSTEEQVDLCGNSVIDEGESCDGSALGDQTCASEGHSYGDLACNADCQLDVGACVDDFYPPAPYGTTTGDIVEDLAFVPANDAARMMAGDDNVFQFRDMYQRNQQHGGELRGAMMFITAGWCVYCPIEARQLEALYQELRQDGILLIALEIENDSGRPATPADAEAYANQYSWTFPTFAGQIPLTYWEDGEGGTPGHIFFDLRNMRIYGRAAGLMDMKMLRYTLRDLVAGPDWGPNGEREISFDCGDGSGNEAEPNGLGDNPVDGSSLPSDLSGTFCPPTIAEGLAVDEDVIDLGTLNAGDVIDLQMSSGDNSPAFPFFVLERLDITGTALQSYVYGPSKLSAGTAGRQIVIDTTGHYVAAGLEGRLMASSHYGQSTPPDNVSCCEGGPEYRYNFNISSYALAATETALEIGTEISSRIDLTETKVFPVTVTQGQRYVFTHKAVVADTMDPYLVLYDPGTSSVLGFNDDTAGGDNPDYNSTITWTADADKTVWLVAQYWQALFGSNGPAFKIKAALAE